MCGERAVSNYMLSSKMRWQCEKKASNASTVKGKKCGFNKHLSKSGRQEPGGEGRKGPDGVWGGRGGQSARPEFTSGGRTSPQSRHPGPRVLGSVTRGKVQRVTQWDKESCNPVNWKWRKEVGEICRCKPRARAPPDSTSPPQSPPPPSPQIPP